MKKIELEEELKKLEEKNEFLIKENEMIQQSFKDMSQTSDKRCRILSVITRKPS